MRLRDYLKFNVWLLPIAILLVPFLLIVFGSTYFSEPSKYYMTQLDHNWSVSNGANSYSNVDLADFNLGSTSVGDTVTISTTLPDISVPSACVMFRSLLSTVTVKIDGHEVYNYGQKYQDMGKLTPKHYNYVSIKDRDLGKTIEITFHITEDNAFSGISTIYYGNIHDVNRNHLQNKRLDLFIGIFLCLFAFILLTLSSYLYMYHGKDVSLLFSSVIAFVLGAYNLSFNDIFNFLSDNDYNFTMLEYISLYSVPFAIIAFLITSHPELNSTIAKIVLAIDTLFPLTTLILHHLNIIHINNFVITLHIISIAEAIVFLPQMILNIHRHYKESKDTLEYVGTTSDSVLLLGLLVFIACCVVDIIKYNFLKLFGGGGEAYSNIGFMTIGALFLVLCLFVFYFYHSIEHTNAAYVKEHLEGLAYTDALTGLMNRAKCMQYMASLHGKFAVISLDMDNLKPVNDTLGHIEGDYMLRAFADIMKQAFVGANLIGRTGGDEFLVIIEQPDSGICEKMIDDLEKRMDMFNKSQNSISLSASCGFAYSKEVLSGSVQDVFILADKRMYIIKEKHHAEQLNKIVSDILTGTSAANGGASHE